MLEQSIMEQILSELSPDKAEIFKEGIETQDAKTILQAFFSEEELIELEDHEDNT